MKVRREYLRGMIMAIMTSFSVGCTNNRSEPVRVVGSSTVFPFAAKVAETYSERTGVSMVVEQTGSGGGHKLFCSGDTSIDATTSSRPQKPSETALCAANGIERIIEIRLGYDGIVLARAIAAEPMALDESILYRGLARELPRSDTDCTPITNRYELWSDIDPSLPDERIEVFGPPPTSGTRDAFVETAMEAGARYFSCLEQMGRDTPNLFRARAHELREDGKWIDAGENDNALVRTLTNTPTALGVFGFSFLDQNAGKVSGIPIRGVVPSEETIRRGDYPVVRNLYLYLRGDRQTDVTDYAYEFVSDEASGEGGYLEEMGLIPLPPSERAQMRRTIDMISADLP